MKLSPFSSLGGYQTKWLRSDLVAALVVTAIAIPESLGFAVIVGLPVQTGLYCALVAPIVFAAFTSSKRLVVGADSATAALVAAGAATVSQAGTPEFANAVAVLGLVTGAVLIAMALFRFGFMADLISKPVLVGFVSGVGVQLLIGKLPEMLGLHAKGTLIDKVVFLAEHAFKLTWPTTIFSSVVVLIVVAGWKFRYPGALLALVGAVVATKIFDLGRFDIEMVGSVPRGFPPVRWPSFDVNMIITLIPAAFSIAVVILAQSLAVIRNAAAKHEERVDDNQDLMALGLANATSAFVGGFAINGSPPRTSAGEMAGGRSQLVNVIMAVLIGITLIFATDLFKLVPKATLAAVVFTIGLHLLKVRELREIYSMRRSEFGIAMAALAGTAVLGVQKGVMFAVILSLMERLRRQYHPHDEVLLRDQKYAQWAADRFSSRHNPLDPPAGLIAYRFGDALFFENAGYFLERVTDVVAEATEPVQAFVLDAGAITDVDYTAAQTIARIIAQLDADEITFSMAHVSPRLRKLLKRYGLTDMIGPDNIYPSLRMAIESFSRANVSKKERIEFLDLETDEYVVIGGAVLELLGIRDTNDLDLVVSQGVYDRLRAAGWKEFVHDDGKRLLTRHGYRVMLHWMGRTVSDLQRRAEKVDGVPIMNLSELIECKSRLGRRKDRLDIQLIEDFQTQLLLRERVPKTEAGDDKPPEDRPTEGEPAADKPGNPDAQLGFTGPSL